MSDWLHHLFSVILWTDLIVFVLQSFHITSRFSQACYDEHFFYQKGRARWTRTTSFMPVTLLQFTIMTGFFLSGFPLLSIKESVKLVQIREEFRVNLMSKIVFTRL